MKMIRSALLAVALVAAVPLASCGNLTAAFNSLTTQTASQVNTLAEGEIAARIVADGVTFAVLNDRALTVDQLNEVKKLGNAVSTALDSLDADQAAGRSLTFGAFNAAIDAYNAYIAQQNIATK